MKSFFINGKDVQVPEGWGDLTVTQFKRFCDAQENIDEDDIQEVQSMKILAYMLSITIEDFYELYESQYNEIISCILFFQDGSPIPNPTTSDKLKIGDKEYKLIQDYEGQKMGAKISYTTVAKSTKKRMVDLLAPALAVYIRGENQKEFDSDKYLEYIQLIEDNCNVQEVFDLSAFFLKKMITIQT